MKGKVQIKHDRAATYYEYWADKYNETLVATFLQTSHWGHCDLAHFYDYFSSYEDEPQITARLKADRLRVVCVYDLHGEKYVSVEQLHKKAMARLRKIERKIIEWRAKYDDTK